MIKTSYAKVVTVFFFSFAVIFHAYGDGFLRGKSKKNKFYIGISTGINFYYGDLKNNNLKAPFYYRYGIHVTAEKEILKSTRLCINLFHGNLLGDELSDGRNLNFKCTIFAPQLGLSYNLFGLSNNDKFSRHFAAYIFAGVECLFFNTTGDLQNGAGEKYYYWSDGTVRNMPEITSNINTAQVISRDYKYETNYRNLDIDNVGHYRQYSFGIPLGLSLEASSKMGLAFRIGAMYHITFTDYLDNITAQSIGTRTGNSKNDKFLYTYAGIYYRLPLLKSRHSFVKSCGYKQSSRPNKQKIKGTK